MSLQKFGELLGYLRHKHVNRSYTHYKSKTIIYKIRDVAIDVDTERPVFLYSSENNPDVLWSRPVSQWDELIVDSKTVSRFSEVDDGGNSTTKN